MSMILFRHRRTMSPCYVPRHSPDWSLNHFFILNQMRIETKVRAVECRLGLELESMRD